MEENSEYGKLLSYSHFLNCFILKSTKFRKYKKIIFMHKIQYPCNLY